MWQGKNTTLTRMGNPPEVWKKALLFRIILHSAASNKNPVRAGLKTEAEVVLDTGMTHNSLGIRWKGLNPRELKVCAPRAAPFNSAHTLSLGFLSFTMRKWDQRISKSCCKARSPGF